jgi:chemotaxis signal transduction protein
VSDPVRHSTTVAEMRAAFDRSFGAMQRPATAAAEDVLGVRVGGVPYALRLADVAGVFAGRPITPLPGEMPGLLGLAGFRGAVLPVYDLGVLLGHGGAIAPRWMFIATGRSVALAVERFEGYLRLERSAIARAEGDVSGPHVRDVARSAGTVRGIVSVSSVLEAIVSRRPS